MVWEQRWLCCVLCVYIFRAFQYNLPLPTQTHHTWSWQLTHKGYLHTVTIIQLFTWSTNRHFCFSTYFFPQILSLQKTNLQCNKAPGPPALPHPWQGDPGSEDGPHASFANVKKSDGLGTAVAVLFLCVYILCVFQYNPCLPTQTHLTWLRLTKSTFSYNQ